MKINRQHRDLLVAAIDRFLNDELSAFEFDDTIFDLKDQTDDETVKRVVDDLWCYYDDCHNHNVVLDKVRWDYFQRAILLLRSDSALELSTRRIWSTAQVVAAVAIAGFLWTVYWVGIGQQLLIATIPFGFVSIALYKWRSRLFQANFCGDLSLVPFGSITQLLKTRRRVSNFQKQHFPARLVGRCIRSGGSEFVNALLKYPAWLVFSPLVLLTQLWPISVKAGTVVP